MIPFNKPYVSSKAIEFVQDAIERGKLSGNGYYTQKCQQWLEDYLNTSKALLTTSCTDALEMCALLLNIKAGDEVILPSYAFVSLANAFVLRGATLVFVDTKADFPNIDPEHVKSKISSKTKAILFIHYAGVSCDWDQLSAIANSHNIKLIEDAAHALGSSYKGQKLGSYGHLATFSFHETKNIHCGEGGALVINDPEYVERAEILWEKGTNRSDYFSKKVSKYEWLDIGSSFLPSELNAALLYSQLIELDIIQKRRQEIWFRYYERLSQFSDMPVTGHNFHMFYVKVKNQKVRGELIDFCISSGVKVCSHYEPLHQSKYYRLNNELINLPNTENANSSIIRLPLFFDLKIEEQERVITAILNYIKV